MPFQSFQDLEYLTLWWNPRTYWKSREEYMEKDQGVLPPARLLMMRLSWSVSSKVMVLFCGPLA